LESDVEAKQARLAARVGSQDARLVVSPYRVCPIGAHIDHQGGPVLGMAISANTQLCFAASDDGHCHLISENYPGEVQFDLRDLAATTHQADPDPSPTGVRWGIYPWAVAAVLQDRLPSSPRGIRACLAGSLPGGGLSSSASVTLAYLLAFAAANEIALGPQELVSLAHRAENQGVGVACGILDPASIIGGRRGHLLCIDTQSTEWEAVPLGNDAPAYRILVAFTGITRNLARTGFNRRVEECQEAARSLGARSGIAGVERLGDLPEELLDGQLEELPRVQRLRARHFRDERARVRRGIALWREGDLAGFGKLMNDSCRSSRENFETGCPELIRLQTIMNETEGVFGSRFSGAGFGGCAVALVSSELAESARARIEEAYRSAHPGLATEAACFLVDSDDGVRLL
jgi:galactokinase/galacturonokinase